MDHAPALPVTSIRPPPHAAARQRKKRDCIMTCRSRSTFSWSDCCQMDATRATVSSAVSVHVDGWILAEYISRGNQDVARRGVRRHRLAAQHLQRQRQHLKPIAIHVVGDGTK